MVVFQDLFFSLVWIFIKIFHILIFGHHGVRKIIILYIYIYDSVIELIVDATSYSNFI